MNSETELFFQNLSAIQNEVISVALIRQNNYNNIEEILTDVSYEVLYRWLRDNKLAKPEAFISKMNELYGTSEMIKKFGTVIFK